MNQKIFLSLFVVLNGIVLYGQTHYDNAITCFEKKDNNQALKYIDSALQLDPSNIEYLILKGQVYYSLKKYQDAYNIYTKTILLKPKESIGYNQRGLLLNALQETEAAINDFTDALNFEKSDTIRVMLFLNRGAAKINIRNFESAYNDFWNAYKIDSLNIGVLNNLATVCDEVGKGEQTLSYLYKIIKLDSTFIGAYGNIGFKLQQMGDYKKSILYFDKIISLDKDEPLAYNNRAFSKHKIGDNEGALLDVNLSIKLYPSNAYAFRNRALIFVALQKNDKACKDFEEALRLGFTKMYGDEIEKLQIKYCKSTLF